MNYRSFIFSICFLFLAFITEAQPNLVQPLSFTAINQIPLQSLSGKKAFIAKKKAPLNLFILLSPECPLCKNYSAVLNATVTKFKEYLQVYGIVPGKAYSGKELQQFVKAYKILFPVLIDGDKAFTNYIQGSVTPEVILADSTGLVVYRGAIDDWVQELGKKKLKPQQHYLDEAITQYLQGKPVSVKQTIPKGCLINEF